ncbi:hypothetical protein MJI20_32245, partial [Salmonella enterica subsp. enterica serovar Anatum]|nr:hypothetical protein [Salmonella enterica subsp. enterica serovar Anatum]
MRPLEREDLRFVHQLDNNASVMRYWFEEPYEAFVEAWMIAQQHKSLLRFLTCGSVDDGKSTLIGRLLHDTLQIYE